MVLIEFYFHRLIRGFKPKIEHFFAGHRIRVQEYIPMLMTTSNVLTERQTDFVCSEIENQREVDDRGTEENVLTDVVLPEFIIHIFRRKFGLSRAQAIERLKTQEERQTLYTEHVGHLWKRSSRRIIFQRLFFSIPRLKLSFSKDA